MEKYQKIDIIYEDNHLLVAHKPANMPSCKDETNDINLLDEMKEYLKIKYQKPGNVYLGLVHRLDRPVEGVMVFAKTSKSASRLSKAISEHNFKKTYYAVTLNNPPKTGTFTDYLTKNKKTNISYVTTYKQGKLATLNYEVIARKNNLTLVKINLKTGRPHQIRLQFSYHGYPILNDHKYNLVTPPKGNIALIAKELDFIHPVTKKQIHFEIPLPNEYPYNLFKIKEDIEA